MYSVRPSLPERKFYPSAIWRIRTNERKIYLTFDDGPVPEVTPRVLQWLQQYQAKATFFCLGENIEKHPGIFRQIISAGHSIGNHTYQHLNGWKTSTNDYLENVKKFNLIVQLQTPNSRLPTLFRPPYGKMKWSQYSMLHSRYTVVMWDVLSGDFDEKLSAEKCLQNVFRKSRPGSIVVFHDSIKAKKNLFRVLPEFLKHFSQKGFAFHALSPRQNNEHDA